MIEFYTGVPGSGKTYKAVQYLYDSFIDEKSPLYGKFVRFYTNINEFKFDRFGEGVGYNLHFDDLLEILKPIHAKSKEKGVSDVDLISMCKSSEIHDSLFVIDEAHNFFDRQNPVLIWWLSYHRHFSQDILLITQNLALIDSKYKKFTERFYRAAPSSLRIFGNVFRYSEFIDSRMSEKTKTGVIKLKFNPDVHSLYGSGANTQGKKVIIKFVLIGLFLLVIMILVVRFASSHLGGSSPKPDPEKIKSSLYEYNPSIATSSDLSDFNNSDLNDTNGSFMSPNVTFFRVVCIDFDCNCGSSSFSLDEFENYKKIYSLIIKRSVLLPSGVVVHLVNYSDEFKKGVLNESDFYRSN